MKRQTSHVKFVPGLIVVTDYMTRRATCIGVASVVSCEKQDSSYRGMV